MDHLKSLGRQWAGLPVRRWKYWAAGAAVLMLAVFLGFFDSHSIARRVQWHRELARVQADNEALARSIAELEVKLEDVSSDEVIEEAAREQYGMRRPGETVYRVARRKPTSVRPVAK